MSAFATFLVLIVIGAGMGFALTRYHGSVRVTGTMGSGDVTSALVGIAGSFMGYHIGLLLGLYNDFVLLVVAAGIAAVTVLAWRGR
jgi:hypothetical protein